MAGFKRRTLQELLSVDINKLTKAELQGYKKVARDEVLRGVKRWAKSESKPPAWYRLEAETGGTMKISFKGKNTLQQLKKELAKAIHFLQDPTHLAKGWKKFKKKNIKALNKEIKQQRTAGGLFKTKFTDKDFDRLYKAYNKAKQINKNVGLYKYEVMETALDIIKDESKSIEEIALAMAESLDSIYEEKEKEKQEAEQTASERMSYQ